MRILLLLTTLLFSFSALTLPTVASTDYNSAISAYDRQEYSKAAKQFSELADQNDPYAQFMLGKMYANGQGVRKDYLQAYKWLYLAEVGGVEAAIHIRNRISKRMSYKKISEAQKMAADWQEDWKAAELQATTNDTYEITDYQVVKMVQQRLREQGYYFGRVDGVSGPGTQNAIMVYQHAKEVKETGKITESLLNLMEIPFTTVQEQPPQTQNEELAAFRTELRDIIKKAKRRNSATPWLIARLERLADGEIGSWPNEVLHENFQDQGYMGSDAWRVIDGSFRLESGIGLIGTANDGWSSSDTIDDLALSLLEVLMNKKQPSTLTQRMSKIQSTQNFSDAFALKVKTGPLQSTEGLLLSCTSSESTASGYQLAFHPGQGEQAKLFRITGNNATEIISKVNPIDFDPGTEHTFIWTRKKNGVMVLRVDDQILLSAKDRKESPQDFDKLALTHFGDEVIFQEIQLRDNSKD